MKRTPVLLIALASCVLSTGQVMAAAAAKSAPAKQSSQSDIGFKAIGGSIAYVSPENLDGTFGLGVFANLGYITPQIGLEPVIEYWSWSQEAFGAKATARDVSVGCRGKYYFEVANPKIRPYAGAGLGLHFVHVETEIVVPGFPTMTADASDTKFGLDLGGGIATPLGPQNDLQAELWYGIVSDVSQFALRVGISHKLGY